MRFPFLLALGALCLVTAARAEDGYDLWLRYQPIEKQELGRYHSVGTSVVTAGNSATIAIARDELVRGLSGLLARKVRADNTVRGNGAVLFGTPAQSPTIAGLRLPLDRAGPEGFVIRSVVSRGRKLTVIAGNTDVGVLHGTFAFLGLIQMRQPVDRLDIVSAPSVKLRMLNHWDNIDRTIERGFAGFSIFNWWELPGHIDPQYIDYARANASLGINGVALTNPSGVSNAVTLTEPWIRKVAALADVLRPYGIKVYLTARFSTPVEIGGLKTADPLDPEVQKWWKVKADDVYRAIPDFGGFVVKANSEGQPGPRDYGRSHAEGANMIADALAPHGGIVIWRAFVYSNQNPEDRVKQAYDEFVPLDGKFRDNVVLQVKNGPLDFQPREPFSPLIGATPKTNLGLEVQTTKEYLGFELHLVYLGTMWQEVLQSDTHVKGPGSTVAKVVDGSVYGNKLTLMAGVSNIGTARNWSGSIFDQANWYAFGRLAWNPNLSAEAIANEWVKLTFTDNPAFTKPVVAMMMASRETAVDYMTPLGLAHQMATGHHYGPGPWIDNLSRADWNPVYYNHADATGIGVDRGATGSNAVVQYAPPLATQLADAASTPENVLLWFHHVPWTYRMKSGRTVWDELVQHYAHGVDQVDAMNATWAKMKPFVDAERFQITSDFLRIQAQDSRVWRDASIAYFQSLSGLPLPAGVAAPEHDLAWYKAQSLPFAPGNPGKTAAPFKND
jgi:alpha-glucuronidase